MLQFETSSFSFKFVGKYICLLVWPNQIGAKQSAKGYNNLENHFILFSQLLIFYSDYFTFQKCFELWRRTKLVFALSYIFAYILFYLTATLKFYTCINTYHGCQNQWKANLTHFKMTMTHLFFSFQCDFVVIFLCAFARVSINLYPSCLPLVLLSHVIIHDHYLKNLHTFCWLVVRMWSQIYFVVVHLLLNFWAFTYRNMIFHAFILLFLLIFFLSFLPFSLRLVLLLRLLIFLCFTRIQRDKDKILYV